MLFFSVNFSKLKKPHWKCFVCFFFTIKSSIFLYITKSATIIKYSSKAGIHSTFSADRNDTLKEKFKLNKRNHSVAEMLAILPPRKA